MPKTRKKTVKKKTVQKKRETKGPSIAKGKKLVYFFGDSKTEGSQELKDLLGGKGAGLADMTRIGAPVPPGFTISTEVCNLFYKSNLKLPQKLNQDVKTYMKKLERIIGGRFGDSKTPLLVSVRSGAKFSMPGMMDTILNLGLNDKSIQGLINKTGKKPIPNLSAIILPNNSD